MTEVYTVGHGARDLEAFLDILTGAGIERLVDIRTAPRSRKHPHFGRDSLERTLPLRGIAYEWWRELGGWRRAQPDSRHRALRSAGFRGYADHMETEEFALARERLIQRADQDRTAAMCAESLWWRCHRRMLADALVAVGAEVRHLREPGRTETHTLSPLARVEDGLPVYDVAEEEGRQPRLAGTE